jgi:hypothetical protein
MTRARVVVFLFGSMEAQITPHRGDRFCAAYWHSEAERSTDRPTGLFSLRSAELSQGFFIQGPNLSQVLLSWSARQCPALPGVQSREHHSERLRGPGGGMRQKRRRHFAFVLLRWLTWFYPRVWKPSVEQGFVLPLHVGTRCAGC